MKITVHQPNFLPYLGFFDKCDYSDILVLYDSTQFKKGDFQNRNKIVGRGGEVLLTVPVKKNLGQKIEKVIIDNSKNWKNKHLGAIENCYSKSKYFKRYFPKIKEIYGKNWIFLSKFNISLIKFFLIELGISCKVILSSEMKLQNFRTLALVEICQKLKSNIYVSGTEGKKYLELDEFKKQKIKTYFQKYHHPIYHQEAKNFTPYLSILDLLFNEGPNSLKILKSGREYES